MANAFTFDRLAETSWAELWNRDLARPERRSREHAGEVGDVKNRRCVKIHSAFGVSHPEVKVLEIGEDVGVRHHNALGMAGCAARVDES